MPKPRPKKKIEFSEGAKAQKAFEDAMKKIFEASRAGSKKPKGKD